MIMRASSALLIVLGLTCPAWATLTLTCSSDDGADIDMTLGTVPVAAIVGARISFGDTSWSVMDNDIMVGQQFSNDDMLIADFTDPNIERIMARLRLFSATMGEDFAMAGVLEIVDHGAYAITCDGP